MSNSRKYSPATVLVAQCDALVASALDVALTEAGFSVLRAASRSELQSRASSAVSLVLLALGGSGEDAVELVLGVKKAAPGALVLVFGASCTVASAVAVMKQGAFHCATVMPPVDALVTLVTDALDTTRLARDAGAPALAPLGTSRLLGESESMGALRRRLERIAASSIGTVLLLGETGTGKDLAAHSIHFASARRAGRFMTITCSALQDSLFESELFGYERGAFTDAKVQKRGLLELADHGTVFLDEIGEISSTAQAKLLRFLEEKSFMRVGGSADIHVDVRVIAATHRNLAAQVRLGKFREDLFYRLSVVEVALPALRERATDVPALVTHFLRRFAEDAGKPILAVTPAALEWLSRQLWPGNVRELRNTVERAVLFAQGDTLDTCDFPESRGGLPADECVQLPTAGVPLEQVERELVVQALSRCAGNRTHAAGLLGLSRDQIRYKIEKFGLGRIVPRLGHDDRGQL